MKALRFALAAVLSFTVGAGTGIAYDAPIARADGPESALPLVESATLPDALGACNDAYNGVAPSTYIDCVNAAYAHFLGRGHHSKLYNV